MVVSPQKAVRAAIEARSLPSDRGADLDGTGDLTPRDTAGTAPHRGGDCRSGARRPVRFVAQCCAGLSCNGGPI